MHPIRTALFDISGPILRLSRVNRPNANCKLSKRMPYGRPQNYTKLRRAFRRNFFAQTSQRKFWQIETGNFFFRKTQILRKQATHGAGRSCVAALQVDSLSTCCEWQKRDRANLSFGHFIQNRFHRPVTFLPLTACAQRIRLQCRDTQFRPAPCVACWRKICLFCAKNCLF